MSKPYLYSAAALALAVFWAVGVSARLARLRAQVGQSFEPLWQLWQRQLALAQQVSEQLAAQPNAQAAIEHQRLMGVMAQFALAAATLQARPTQSRRSDMLILARALLHPSWARAVALLPAPTPESDEDAASLPSQWEVLCHQEMLPLHGFNTALQAHNQAVTQFPAWLLARLWGFRPGRLLRVSDRA